MKQQLSIEHIRQLENECRRERSEAIFNTIAGLPRSIWTVLAALELSGASRSAVRKRTAKRPLGVSAG